MYRRIIKEGEEKARASRTPVFPPDWYDKNSFGESVEEHRKMLQVNIFNGYTVFSVKDRIHEEKPVDHQEPHVHDEQLSEGKRHE